jgi:molecular chaperone DnaK (HSP70)
MSHIIGIDLGTTYCCVAIPEARGGEGFYTPKECPGCSILQDKFKRMTTPSVVAENSRGQIEVGYTAKGMAGFTPEPIMFAKRSMGEDVTFLLDKQGMLRPEEVSGHILRHLKQLAEERLGGPVTEAVITVPAYFTLKAKQLTEEAGKLAGLKVAQVVQEPVAAALAYCANDTRDPLRILTYDLGGGTFDVAILEKRDGTISTDSVKAFDGDRFLGGYDFDKRLTLWLIERLRAKGYDLDPNDTIVFAKLMVFAERAKVALSRQEYVEIREEHSGINDRQGTPVVIQEDVTREQFEAMIAADIDYTIDICKRAMLEKADPPIKMEQIDEIVMVGGSSRIPLVTAKLEEAFGRKPKLVNPDLCVALGAAILAGAKTRTIGRLRLDPIPETTDLEMLTITGSVLPVEGDTGLSEVKVRLEATDDSTNLQQSVRADGGFVFEGVILAPEAKTDFILTVTNSQGATLVEHKFTVEQSEKSMQGGLVETVTNILAKPIGLMLVDGPFEVAPVRTSLPFNTRLAARTMDNSGEIRIPILEDNILLGEIVMNDLPKTLEIGSAVEIALEVQENYQIIGRATIRSLDREIRVVIDIPVPRRKSIDELRNEFVHLDGLAQDVKTTANRGALFTKVGRLDKRIDSCREMLTTNPPELLKIQDCLNEIENLIREIGAGWRPQPPRANFQQKAAAADARLATLLKERPELREDGYDHQLEAIRKEADEAYGVQNSVAWGEANRKMEALSQNLARLQGEVGGQGASQLPPPDPASLVLDLSRSLTDLERVAKEKGRYEGYREEFEECAVSLKKIDPKVPDAMSRIVDWYRTKYEPLMNKVTGEDDGRGAKGFVGLETIGRK